MSWRSGGVRTFVMQRLTAVYVGVFAVALVFHFVSSPPADFDAWRVWVGSPFINVAFIAFCLAVILHAWIGMRDVIMDYVADDTLRFIVLTLVGLFLLFMGLWAVKSLMMVSFA